MLSRQAGHPRGLFGRFIGRAMVRETKEANDRNRELIGDVRDRTVIELGFGQGRTVELLEKDGAHVLGVDVSETMLAQASARNQEAIAAGRVDLRIGDGVELPFDDECADALITAHTIYFWPDHLAVLAEIHRVLRPGSRLAIAFNGADGMRDWMDPEVYRTFDTPEVVELLDKAGFADIEVINDPRSKSALHWVSASRP